MPDRRPELRLVPPGPRWPDWLEQWIVPYVREPVLWPVLIAVMGHAVVAVAALELAVWRVGSLGSGAVLALLAVGSFGLVGFEVRRFGRPGPVSVTLALSWIASVLFSGLAERTGIL